MNKADEQLLWQLERVPSREQVEELHCQLVAYNITTARMDEGEDIAVFVRDHSDKLVGGVMGTIWGACLEIAYLWVDQHRRGTGIGGRLLTMIEAEAALRGCRNVVLDTYTFQAPEFYQRRGYKEIGRVGGYPNDYKKVFFHKDLGIVTE